MKVPRLSLAALLATLAMLAITVPGPALAVQPDERLADPALEARARDISKELRCLVCQNQSIDDSNAQLARDLRIIVRERLVAGDSNAEIFEYVTARYGDFIRLRPPFRWDTALLWFGPLLVLIAGLALAVPFIRGQHKTVPEGPLPLEPADRALLDRILAEDDDARGR